MKAGLFLCDHVHPDYQNKFGNYAGMFAQLFPELEWEVYDAINGEFPEDLNTCDVYMATGSHHSVYENLPWITQLKNIIRELYQQKKYFIGFCFGHQLIGEALGGKVEKSSNGWCVGVHDFEIKTSMPWIQPAQNSLSLLMMCQDQIVELPENAKVLASAEKCRVGMVQVGETILGIQSHPEFSKEYDKFLMEMRIDRIPAKVVEEGLASFEKTIHPLVIHDWMMRFIS